MSNGTWRLKMHKMLSGESSESSEPQKPEKKENPFYLGKAIKNIKKRKNILKGEY